MRKKTQEDINVCYTSNSSRKGNLIDHLLFYCRYCDARDRSDIIKMVYKNLQLQPIATYIAENAGNGVKVKIVLLSSDFGKVNIQKVKTTKTSSCMSQRVSFFKFTRDF